MENEIEFEFIPEQPKIGTEKASLEFGFEGICNSIVSIVKRAPNPFTIGLIGKWGSGKSTIIENAANKLKKDNIPLFNFDVWKHEDDSLRRSFLLELHRFLDKEFSNYYRNASISDQLHSDVIEESEGSKIRRKELIAHAKVLFALTFAVVSGISIAYFIFLCFGKDIIPFLKEVVPELTGLIAITFLIMYIEKFVKTTKTRTIASKYIDPHQFEEEFVSILDKLEADRIVIAFDNLDRLSEKDILNTITTIKTFLEPFNKKVERKISVVFIVPCDYAVVKDALKKNEAGEFLKKIFNIIVWIPEFHEIELEKYARGNLVKTRVKCLDDPEIASLIVKVFKNNPRQIIQFINTLLGQFIVLKSKENLNEFKGNFSSEKEILNITKFILLKEKFPLIMNFIEERKLYRVDIDFERFKFEGNKKNVGAFNEFIKEKLHGISNNVLPLLYTLKYSEQENSIPGIGGFFDQLENGDVKSAEPFFSEIFKDKDMQVFNDLLQERVNKYLIHGDEHAAARFLSGLIIISTYQSELKLSPRNCSTIISFLKDFKRFDSFGFLQPKGLIEFFSRYNMLDETGDIMKNWIDLARNYFRTPNTYLVGRGPEFIKELIKIYPSCAKNITNSIGENDFKNFVLEFIQSSEYNSEVLSLLGHEINKYLNQEAIYALIDRIKPDQFNEPVGGSILDVIFNGINDIPKDYVVLLLHKLSDVGKQIHSTNQDVHLFLSHIRNFIRKYPVFEDDITVHKVGELFEQLFLIYGSKTDIRERNGFIALFIEALNVKLGNYDSIILEKVQEYFSSASEEKIHEFLSVYSSKSVEDGILNLILGHKFNYPESIKYFYNNLDETAKTNWVLNLLRGKRVDAINLLESIGGLNLSDHEEIKLLLLNIITEEGIDLLTKRRLYKLLEEVSEFNDEEYDSLYHFLENQLKLDDTISNNLVREFLIYSKWSDRDRNKGLIEKLVIGGEKGFSYPILNILIDNYSEEYRSLNSVILRYSVERLAISNEPREIRLLYSLIQMTKYDFEIDEAKLFNCIEKLLFSNIDLRLKEVHKSSLLLIAQNGERITRLKEKIVTSHKIIIPSDENLICADSNQRCISIYHSHYEQINLHQLIVDHGSLYISKREMISEKEAISGGEYNFVLNFNIPCSKENVRTARICFFVDDSASITFNGKFVGEGSGASTEILLTEQIQEGQNDLEIKIINKSFANEYENNPQFRNNKEKWSVNPFCINYVVEIDMV